jgi:hypothetical protein
LADIAAPGAHVPAVFEKQWLCPWSVVRKLGYQLVG